MDKGKVFRLVLIPIVAGLIVTLVFQRLMMKTEQTGATPKAQTVPVVTVAAKEPIPARTKLTELQFVVKQIPKDLATGNEFGAVTDLVGKISMIDLQPGEVVLNSRVVTEGQGSLPYRIPAGMRAVTIRMDELNGVGGHPVVGDLVDLILFLPEKQMDGGVKRTYPAQTRVLYEAVQVLGKGSAALEAVPKTAGQPVETKLTSITLALTPQAATEVALAEQIGYIKMVLRPALKQPDVGSYQTDEAKYRNNPLNAPAQPNR